MAESTLTGPNADVDPPVRTSANTITGSTVAPHPSANPPVASRPSPDSASASSRSDVVDVDSSASHEQLAVAAYYCAARRGFAPGHELDDWLEAESALAATTVTLARGVR
jgi:hypothetical protein